MVARSIHGPPLWVSNRLLSRKMLTANTIPTSTTRMADDTNRNDTAIRTQVPKKKAQARRSRPGRRPSLA